MIAVHNNTMSVRNLVKSTPRFDRTGQTREEKMEGRSSSAGWPGLVREKAVRDIQGVLSSG